MAKGKNHKGVVVEKSKKNKNGEELKLSLKDEIGAQGMARLEMRAFGFCTFLIIVALALIFG